MKVEKTSYNPKAVYGTVPKALIHKYLFRMKGSTGKVLLALIEGTDCYYRIAYKNRRRSRNIAETAGVHENSVSAALKELEKLGIIDGYVPGRGENLNQFHFTFDIDHYKEQKCLLVEEIEDYFRHLSLRRVDGFFIPEEETVTPSHENSETSPENCDTNIDTGAIHEGVTVQVALRDQEFLKQFNEFCIENGATYRTQTLNYILNTSMLFKLSIGETIEALTIANRKARNGSTRYLTGVMRNVKKRKTLGIGPAGMSHDSRVYEYVMRRISGGKEFLSFFDFDGSTLTYKLKNSDDALVMCDWFSGVAVDVERETGTKILIQAA